MSSAGDPPQVPASGSPRYRPSLNNLGRAVELREYAAAKQSHEQRWRSAASPCLQDHPVIAQSLNNLGLVQSALREYAAAKQSHEQALAIRRKSLPPDHPDIAQSLNNLGDGAVRVAGVCGGQAEP